MESIKHYSSEIIERIASFFEMCLSQDAVPIDLLEEKLAWSEAFSSLERGDPCVLLRGEVGDLYKKTFNATEPPNQYVSDSRAYWIGESYARIFIKEGASISRIALLLSIREMKELFLPYHEMDFEQIAKLYETCEAKRSILECLKKKRGISYVAITRQAKISKTNLFRMKSNEALNRIRLEEAQRLSLVLDCPVSCFLRRVLPPLDE